MNARFIANLEAAGKLAASIAARTERQLAQSTYYRLREQIMTIITSSIADGVSEVMTGAEHEAIERCQAVAAAAFAGEFERLKSGGAL